MPKTTMRKYLRKPKGRTDPGPLSKWKNLYKQALQRAEATGDTRLKDLKHWASDPEVALRHLSIVSQVDLDREFPS